MKIRNLFGCIMTLLFVFVLSVSHDSSAQPLKKEVSKEFAKTAIQSIHVKEAYKVDDAEYTVGIFSKSNLGSGRAGIEGIALLGGFALAFALFKKSKTLFALFILGFSLCVIEQLVFNTDGYSLAVLPLVPMYRDPGANEGGGLSQEMLDDAMKKMSKKTSEAIAESVEKATKGKIGMEEFKAGLKEAGIEEGTIKKLEGILKEQGAELAKLKSRKTTKRQKGAYKEVINAAFEDKDFLDDIAKSAKRKGSMSKDAWDDPDVNKVNPTTVTTGNITTDTGGNALFDLLNADEIDDLNLQVPFIEDYCSVSRTSRAAFIYADFLPLNGDAGFTAENAPKSQLDFKVQVKSLSPKKVTAYDIMSEEAVTDVPQLQSVANTILLKKVLLKRQNGILFGDGTGNQPIGVQTLAKKFDPTTWSANAPDKVVQPNLYDCIIAGANQIQNTFNYVDENEYYPNLVLLNPKDFAALKLKKNQFNQYLFPQFVIGPNKDQVIDDLRIVSRRQIPAGKVMMGDFQMLRIINYVDYNLRMGYINDQLINNLFTMVGESRFFTLIKTLDTIAFIYDDISAIQAGITAG